MRQFMRFLARYAAMCGVKVFGWVMGINHFHLLCSQAFTGLHKKRRRGISPMMRNLNSQMAKFLNGYYSHQGVVFERAFHSSTRTTAEEVLSALVYILVNPDHHWEGRDFIEYAGSAARVYFHSGPDGVCTDLPGIFSEWEGTPEEKAARLAELVKEIWSRVEDKAKPKDLLEKTRAVVSERRGIVARKGWDKAIPVAVWFGEEAAEAQVKKVRAHVPAFEPFHPRSAPRVGAVITIRVASNPKRRLDVLTWRDVHCS